MATDEQLQGSVQKVSYPTKTFPSKETGSASDAGLKTLSWGWKVIFQLKKPRLGRWLRR